jgi:hypothetical protein
MLALLGSVPIAAPAHAQAAGFKPSAEPMLYTRTLRREMAGGASLTVKRSFAIRFVPVEGGFRVEGEQVGVDVEAPAALASFAQLERERRETRLFPLTLDSGGRISSTAGLGQAAQLDAAVREASAMLDRRNLPPDERQPVEDFIRALHQSAAGLLTELPADLFAPREAVRTDTREVALPGGGAGTVTVRFNADIDAATGLVRKAEREVVSDLGGDRRRTLESWTLAPI